MPLPKPPSSVQPITFPVFGLSWFATPNGEESIVAYGGGGGSAKTGFSNKIIVQFLKNDEDIIISTDVDVCVCLVVYQEFPSEDIFILAAIGKTIRRYFLSNSEEGPSFSKAGEVNVGEGCNTLAVHAMGQVFAVGCDDGPVHVYQMAPKDAPEASWTRLFSCLGHEKTVCGISFALRSDHIVSSAKDGTARVWKQGGECLSFMKCDITDPAENNNKTPKTKNRRPPQILVRGCAFGDLEGKLVFTIASGRKGKAFLSKWSLNDATNEFELVVRTAIHTFPISSMNLSADGSLLALGAVNGTILLVDVTEWKVVKKFNELHELPVTCVAARPYMTMPLAGDEEGIPLHARSASADSKMGLLTMSKKRKRRTTAAQEIKKQQPGMSLPMLLW
eukprot:CAMPEP_0194133212 /NCGR_PEP_ID=MMETSP0152-20130528/3476_1 /TAXON_ID=1049557 /ORGANISM="Thalassiothrix antarctica, Strain L6-D1" /LENGTH=390 /DNA_ID=CAMNT_0038828481 /DNA_START=35 /DNA_END=1204 /DNA_ORIENTATION=-